MAQKTFLTLVAFLVSSTAFAADAILPVRAVVDYDAPGLKSWTFQTSGNVKNGEHDRTGMIELRFASAKDADGNLVRGLARVPVRGLKWYAGFRKVVAWTGEAHVICAEKTWLGLRVNKDLCRLEGRVIPNPDTTEGGFIFDGQLVVRQ